MLVYPQTTARPINTSKELQPFKINGRWHLDLEESGNEARSPLNTAGASFFNVLGIVGRDDILACLGMIHLGLGMWEEAVEAPVK